MLKVNKGIELKSHGSIGEVWWSNYYFLSKVHEGQTGGHRVITIALLVSPVELKFKKASISLFMNLFENIVRVESDEEQSSETQISISFFITEIRQF